MKPRVEAVLVNDRKRFGLFFAGVKAGVGVKERTDGIFSVRSEAEAIIIDIEVDMLAHDGLVHFLGVDFYIVGEVGVVRESVLEALADEPVDFGGEVFRRRGDLAGECGCRVGEGGQVAAENDSTQRDGCAGLFSQNSPRSRSLVSPFCR